MRLPFQSGKGEKSLMGLNIAQSLGVMNDNMFKLLLVFLLIEVEGSARANNILSAAGALFVIPFLLFSPTAGVLADRFSKQRLILSMKIIEMTLLFLAIFSFAFRSAWGGYTLLFLLATHSALFAPSKYGIIPELVPADRVSRANGLITACTYLAMIVGTFLASFLTDVTHRSFAITVSICFFFAIVGFFAACAIRRTPPQGSSKKFSPLFFLEVYRTLRFAFTIRHLFISLCSSAFFLFVGAYTQLNIIPYAMQGLGLTDVDGGYLFLATALGIAGGSYLAGKVSKKRVELGLPCISALAISILFICLSITTTTLPAVILLILLGLFGGAFIVPFDTFTQLISPQEKRGQIIAAGSFLSFLGVLIASFFLYLFGSVLEISSSKGFALMGIITLFVAGTLTVRLSDLALPFFSRIFLHPILRVRSSGLDLIEKSPDAFLILERATPMKSLLFLGAVPQAQLFIPWRHNHRKRSLFYSITYLDPVSSLDEAMKACRARLKPQMVPCLLTRTSVTTPKSFSFFGLGKSEVLYISVEKDGVYGWQITLSKEPKAK